MRTLTALLLTLAAFALESWLAFPLACVMIATAVADTDPLALLPARRS